MINLRKRGNKYYLWGEHLGVKVQKATKTDIKSIAEQMRADKVEEIEKENPTLASAYYIQKKLREAKEKKQVEPAVEYDVGDWRNFSNWTLADTLQVYIDSSHTSMNAMATAKTTLRHVMDRKMPQRMTDIEDIIDVWNSRRDQRTSNSTINTYLTTLKAVLNFTEKWLREHQPDLSYRVPAFQLRPSEQLREDVYLSPEEAERFLNVVEDHWPDKHHIYLMLAYTGVRPVELARLKWQDVYLKDDVNDSLIVVRHKKGRKGGEVWRKRNVPMHPKVHTLLTKINDRTGAVVKRYGGHYPTSTPSGKNKAPSFCYYPFKKAKWLSQLPDHITCYSLRHTFASWLRGNNVPLDGIASIMGHSNIKTTMRYAHLSNDDKARYVHSI